MWWLLAILIGAIPALVLGIGLGAAAQAGFGFPPTLTAAFALVERWQTLIGASVALLVASIAWRAAQQQIAVHRELAKRGESEMFEVICLELEPILKFIETAWRITEETILF